MSPDVLFQWPTAAEFGRVVPKTRFYERGGATAPVRQKFVDEVQRITWTHKLSDETVRLRGNSEVPEIQVFVLDAKDEDVSNTVLAAIDRAIFFPIIFEITRNDDGATQTRMTACHKQLDGRKPKLSAYLSGRWLPTSLARAPLPPALDLVSLYLGLLAPIMPISARDGEQLSKSIERISHARRLEREIGALERRLQTEPQLNRKVVLRRDLQNRSAALEELRRPTTQNNPTQPKKVAKWTS